MTLFLHLNVRMQKQHHGKFIIAKILIVIREVPVKTKHSNRYKKRLVIAAIILQLVIIDRT